MSYTEYTYLWPPRPETAINREGINFYERRGWHAQVKKNGTCTVIFSRGSQVIYKTRHNEDHKLWTPQEDHNHFFSGRKNWNVYAAELLHSKVGGGPKHTLYIFDLLVQDGVYLTGTTFNKRQALLHDMFRGRDEGDQVRVAPRVTLARCFTEGFDELFTHLKPEDEGIVLKRPGAVLLPCYKPDSNRQWQVKCRIPNSNYSFSLAFALNSLIVSIMAGVQWADLFTFGMT